MKRHLGLALFLLVSACGLYAQVTDTTVCDVLKSPQSFDGKIVRIKGTVAVSFDQFVIHADDCNLNVNGIWLSYPQGTKGKAAPLGMVELKPAHNFGGAATATARTAVTLDKSKDFKEFDNLLSQPHEKGTGVCMGCEQNQVNATVVGRLDGVANTALKRDPAGKIIGLGGFGNLNAYPARLVIQSVSDVTVKPEDYSKADAITMADDKNGGGGGRGGQGGGAPGQMQGMIDPLQLAQKQATALAGKPLGAQIQAAIDVFPKAKGQQNGVSIVYNGTMNEAPASEAPSAQDSPDGVLFVCTMNKDKIKADAAGPAIIHLGQHVVDMKTPLKGNEDAPLMVLENNAWVVSSESSLAAAAKFVTLPGGYLMWNYKWPQAEQVTNMSSALNTFIGTEEMLSR